MIRRLLLLVAAASLTACASMPDGQRMAYEDCMDRVFEYEAQNATNRRTALPQGVEPMDYCFQIARAFQRDLDSRGL